MLMVVRDMEWLNTPFVTDARPLRRQWACAFVIGAMVLRVSLLPSKRAFSSGGTLNAKIQVANHSDKQSGTPFAISVGELSVECTGTERIDRTWVGLAYGADSVPLEKDNRRETRLVFQTKRLQLGGGFSLVPGEERTWNITLKLPDWLPPSFRGVVARCSYVLTASITFSASPAAMKLLTHHLSIEGVKRGSGSLMLVPQLSKSLGQGKKEPSKPATVPIEQVAAAKIPLLILPAQRLRNDSLSDRRIALPVQAVLSGEDAELQPVSYQHVSPDYPLHSEIMEVSVNRKMQTVKHRSLPRGISLSRSDLTSLPDGAERVFGPLRPVDAWPELPLFDTRVAPGNEGLSKPQEAAGYSDRQSPLPPATPMTGSDATASTKSFNLRLADDLLVRLALCPPPDNFVGLGTTLSGTLDFRSSQEASTRDPALPKCVQVTVLLETEEQVHSRWTQGLQASPAGIRKVQDEHQELTPDTLLTHFMLSIPFDAPASFSTHLLALRWVLRFEFTTVCQTTPSSWFGGSGKGSDRLTWSLPILVKPSR